MTIRRGYVDTNEGQVHYRSIESGTGTPVVLLHSVGSASAMYEGLMAELAGERPFYALDTPGYGGSAFPPPDPSAEDYARMLLAASAALGLDRFHCVGHHNGAAIACEMAASAPARVASAIFSGIPYLSTEELAEWKDLTPPLVLQADGSHLTYIWNRLQSFHSDTPLSVLNRETVESLRAGERWQDAYGVSFKYDMPARLPQVRCPILLLCGKDDLLLSCHQRAKEARPDAQHVEVEGTSFLMDDNPAGAAAAIRSFLEGIPAT